VLRRLSLLWVMVLCAAGLALPAVAAAAANPYQVTVLAQACKYHGGAHGAGYVLLNVKAREIGQSGTNYFVVKSEVQASSGLAWGTQVKWPKETSLVFPDDSSNYYHLTDRRYDFPKGFEVGARIVIRVQFWSNTNGLLATRTVNGTAC
jgi:hypothetical protein